MANLRKRRPARKLTPRQEEVARIAAEHERLAQYRATFEPAWAQEVLADLIRRAGVFQTSETVDPLEIAFNEGRRWVVLHIVNSLSADPLRLARLLLTGDTEEIIDNEDAPS